MAFTYQKETMAFKYKNFYFNVIKMYFFFLLYSQLAFLALV